MLQTKPSNPFLDLSKEYLMDKQLAIQSLTDTMAKFTAYIGKRLPKDVNKKLIELRTLETNPLAKSIYDSMDANQQAADKLDRPSCQDTGVIQYFVEAGAHFPLLGELQEILQEATAEATRKGPLRHNAVETFDEKIQEPTQAHKFHGWTGALSQKPIPVPLMSTWQAAVVPFLVLPKS
jgi:tartrate dehydratase alpha subunit/fumarate hydratase class I-like protein